LHSFDGTDGANPTAGLILANNGDLYGTTTSGDTIFKITPSGTLTTLATLDGYPYAGLIQGTDGNLYGTTEDGGAGEFCPSEYGCGTAFSITPGGTLTTLYTFCAQTNCTDGEYPMAGLIQATSGDFYGATYEGGTSEDCAAGCGTIFMISKGLSPFIETVPTSGKVDATVTILGYGLSGATSVTLNGTAAVFTVESNSEIRTTVPTGATTGTVQVTTDRDRTLPSNVPFTVRP